MFRETNLNRRGREWLRLGRYAVLVGGLVAGVATGEPARDASRGVQFIGLESFGQFTTLAGTAPGETVLLSKVIPSRLHWDELIVSWNAVAPPGTYLRFEACGLRSNRPTPFYQLGQWSTDPQQHPRTSVRGQRDAVGEVDTDTLKLRALADAVQLRITLGSTGPAKPRLKFLGLALRDSSVVPIGLPPNQAAWGKCLAVPERSQMAYAGGDNWCSPTTVSMLLAYWSGQLKRPELDRDVPEVAAGVDDPAWGGTGNWVFNTAYAGSFPPLRAYTTRFTDVAELEDWIAREVPVGVSLCYNRLRGRPPVPSGHLVVCVGFTDTGDVILNDPGTRQNVRKIFPRGQFAQAWDYSGRTVYLVHPQAARLPKDRFGRLLPPARR
jgi:hypothetical protein